MYLIVLMGVFLLGMWQQIVCGFHWLGVNLTLYNTALLYEVKL